MNDTLRALAVASASAVGASVAGAAVFTNDGLNGSGQVEFDVDDRGFVDGQNAQIVMWARNPGEDSEFGDLTVGPTAISDGAMFSPIDGAEASLSASHSSNYIDPSTDFAESLGFCLDTSWELSGSTQTDQGGQSFIVQLNASTNSNGAFQIDPSAFGEDVPVRVRASVAATAGVSAEVAVNGLGGGPIIVGPGDPAFNQTFILPSSQGLTNISWDASSSYFEQLVDGESGGASARVFLKIDIIPAPGPVAVLAMGGLVAARRRR